MTSQKVVDLIEKKILTEIKNSPEKLKGIGDLKLGISITDMDGGNWIFDFTKKVPTVTRTEITGTDVTVKVNGDDFIGLYEKKLDPQMAFFSGKLKIDGNLSLALRLKNLF